MNPIARNIVAVLLGIVIGGSVNSALVSISGDIIALPDGFDPNDPESLIKYMPLFETKHFIMPFLSHALGTFVGAIVTGLICTKKSINLVYLISGVFFLGGTIMLVMISSPIWFTVLDLVGAYFPMAWLAKKLLPKKSLG
jgi:hypothetical protein